MFEQIVSPLLPFVGQPVELLAQKYPRLNQHKGQSGQLIERILGADAGALSAPDLQSYGVEIKTLPIDDHLNPLENTYISKISIPFRENFFERSTAWGKLQKVLWVPLMGKRGVPLLQKIICYPLLWTPSVSIEAQLRLDWLEITCLIRQGLFDQINSQLGEYLHVRPKAQHSRHKVTLSIADNSMKVVPIGFYLRKKLTKQIIEEAHVSR